MANNQTWANPLKTEIIRLILGDQLNQQHSWFEAKSPNVCYLIVEVLQETNYVTHHVQKLCGFFAAMQEFAEALTASGHHVKHLTLDDTQQYADLPTLLTQVCADCNATVFEYQRPDEYRLREQLGNLAIPGVRISAASSEHFLLPDADIDKYFSAGQATRMESFYRKMRQRFDVLMENGEPISGQWNFDSSNRQKLKPADFEKIPEPLKFENDVSPILERLKRHQVKHFGTVSDSLLWPVNLPQSQKLLDHFCTYCLPNFGRYQDAMVAETTHSWSLYHSRLSFAMNIKILSPLTVLTRAIDEYHARPDAIDIAQIEGFVRQILGWREFVRGIYWVNMPSYGNCNSLQATQELPTYFWSGETKMRCLQHSLDQSLEYAYAHHIQRLMVIGNFCLLAGIDPDAVDAWYLGVYIDAIEWVEMPNTRGMSQFADDGLLASKPYSASGAYINRMSNYCSGCHYQVKTKAEERSCPFNSLYWHFMNRHRSRFKNNPRIGMIYRNLEQMESGLRDATLARGDWLLENLEGL